MSSPSLQLCYASRQADCSLGRYQHDWAWPRRTFVVFFCRLLFSECRWVLYLQLTTAGILFSVTARTARPAQRCVMPIHTIYSALTQISLLRSIAGPHAARCADLHLNVPSKKSRSPAPFGKRFAWSVLRRRARDEMRLPDATVAAELHTENHGGGGQLTEDFLPHPSSAIAAPRDLSRFDLMILHLPYRSFIVHSNT